ncbi:hypothetical protein DNH61_12760 [Paenibacillus sambharensis]|uniref:Carrier domain-containing protein n=2 Tax=Paenibacillus sambharensis TaxID=1803190 RepID=A0A2W1LVC6_9BACL|nr:phosphopantetheine-binding protein [Paenibacillus sambharensis]PZD95731.1 hypothetical protein DNH61_12760 [Paenibacillus sambharensis]
MLQEMGAGLEETAGADGSKRGPLAGTLSEELRLNEDLRLDSVMLLQLLVLIETRLGLQVPENEVDPGIFDTVGSLVDFMQELDDMNAPDPVSGPGVR